jgi:hypothetical protein
VITVETAKIYHVGNRRFLTERAAFRHMARLRVEEKRPCECETSERDDLGRTIYEGFTCARHHPITIQRYARFLRRAWKRGWRPSVRCDPDLHILQHALGLDDYGQGNAYRNRYVATDGSDDFARCQAHVEAGRMVRHGPSDLFGGGRSFCFVVTDAGRQYVRERSPKPPRLTRSQRRYREWLNADSGMPFGEWIREGQYR